MNRKQMAKVEDFTEKVSEAVMAATIDAILSGIRHTNKVPKEQVNELVGFVAINALQICLVGAVTALRELHKKPMTSREVTELSTDLLYCCSQKLKYLDDLVTIPSPQEKEVESN